MIEYTTDDVFIFELLESVGLTDFNSQEPTAFAFAHQQNTYFFTFQPQGHSKGCILYQLEQHPTTPTIQNLLLMLSNLPENTPIQKELKAVALLGAEQMLLNGKSQARFFDAH